MNKVEIICQNCKQDTLLKREPIYDGFNKIGTKFVCASCGFIFKNEESISFKISKNKKSIFNNEGYIKQKKIFDEDENNQLCRYCSFYLINPFTQYCSIHKKEVEATDTCDKFEKSSAKKNDIL